MLQPLININIIGISISCAIYVLFTITIDLTCYVYTSVFSHCTGTLPLKQLLKTFNYNFTLVYYKGD